MAGIASLYNFIVQYWQWCGILLLWAPYAAVSLECRVTPHIENELLRGIFFVYCAAGTIMVIALNLLVLGVTHTS